MNRNQGFVEDSADSIRSDHHDGIESNSPPKHDAGTKQQQHKTAKHQNS